jgi:hypothetical protein
VWHLTLWEEVNVKRKPLKGKLKLGDTRVSVVEYEPHPPGGSKMHLREAFRRVLELAAKDIDAREAVSRGKDRELDRDGEAWRLIKALGVGSFGLKEKEV